MKIYSSNEWDPLKEVIVGNVFDTMSIETDLSFKLFFKDNLWGWLSSTSSKIQIKKQYIDELNEDLDKFVKVLKDHKITVHRPVKLNSVPYYNVAGQEMCGMPALNVRDQAIVIGDTVVETAPCQRSRYHENKLFHHILEQGKGHWLKMPKSDMYDSNFDHELIQYKSKTSKQHKEDFNNPDFFKTPDFIGEIPANIQIMIDGANCVRFGKDILINIANRNHYLGYLWFKDNFPQQNWHPIYSLCDNHIDSFILPLDEGVLLLRNEAFFEQMPDFLKDWKIIYPPAASPQFPTYANDDAVLTSTFIDMNVLSIGHKKIITNSLYPELSELLYQEGFDPIPIQHRHRRIFAGGFHCFTLDLLREKA